MTDLFSGLDITLESHWPEFDTPGKWRRWLDLYVQKEGERSEFADDSCCYEYGRCAHLDAANSWCSRHHGPAAYNPVMGTLGMACCGFGHSNGNGKPENNDG